MNDKLHDFILHKRWDQLVDENTTTFIVESLPFEQVMSLAYDLYTENFLESPKIRDFSLNLFFAIKKRYFKEWENDWKNDIFLSDLCRIGYKYDECYYCCMRAYKKFDDPPPAVLIALAGCIHAPQPRVTHDQAESLLQRAILKEISYEAALLLRGIYRTKGDQAKIEYWEKIVEETKQKNLRTDPCTPDIFKEKL